MEDYLYQKDLHWPIKEKLKSVSNANWMVKRMPKGMDDDEWELLDRKALGAIHLSLTKSVAFNIKDQEKVDYLMKTLSNLYEQPSATMKVYLTKKLVNLKMSENQSFKDYLNQFNEVKDELSLVSMVIYEEFKGNILFT